MPVEIGGVGGGGVAIKFKLTVNHASESNRNDCTSD